MMKTKCPWCFCAVFFTCLFVVSLIGACGGGGGGSSSSDTGSGAADSPDDTATTGTASLKSLNTVPDTDLSTLDYSTSGSTSSSLSALVKEAVVAESGAGPLFLGENIGSTGSSSRAGCEYNMMKNEIKRNGFMVVTAKCAANAMATAGLITLPTQTGESLSYLISPPDVGDEEKQDFCNDIKNPDEKAHCESGEGAGPGGDIVMRLALGDSNQLQIDVWEEHGSKGLLKRMEGAYTADGTLYGIDVVSVFDGFFGDNSKEQMQFFGDIDIGTDGTVEKGKVTLGAGGAAEITMKHVGSFGSGRMTFTANADSEENEVKAYWKGGFTDSNSSTTIDFEDKLYSLVGAATGCSKYSFSGGMPPEPVSNIVPWDLSPSNLGAFLTQLSAEIGIKLTPENYTSTFVCFNSEFDPASPDPAQKPMVPLAAGETACPDVTHTAVECFGVTNATVQTDFGAKVTQSFAVIAPGNASQFDAVNAFDLGTISSTIETPAYARGTDVPTDTTTVDFFSLTPTQAQAFQEDIQGCFEVQERAREGGMEEYGCGKMVMNEATNDFAEDGGKADWCYAGGDHALKASQPTVCPQVFFNDCLSDPAKNGNGEYCAPGETGCTKYNLVAGFASGLTVPLKNESGKQLTMTNINFFGPAPACVDMNATFTFNTPDGPLTRTCNYNCHQPDAFAPPPPEEDFEFKSDAQQGQEGFLPKACVNAGITDPKKCEQFCLQHDCSGDHF